MAGTEKTEETVALVEERRKKRLKKEKKRPYKITKTLRGRDGLTKGKTIFNRRKRDIELERGRGGGFFDPFISEYGWIYGQ